MNYSSIAVFCGSKNGKTPLFQLHANELGKLMAAHQQTLIYGGGNVGIMGVIANTMMENGGTVIGVIPELLKDREHHHEGITELIIVSDMHSRKKRMYELCDAAVILPGGFGTLDELFEMLTWNQLNIHNKKIILLNSGGYYDNLIGHLHQMEAEGFLYESVSNRITICATPAEIYN